MLSLSLNKLSIYLLHLTILLILMLPIQKLGLVDFGGINVYIYEFPLLASYTAAALIPLFGNGRIDAARHKSLKFLLLPFLFLVVIGMLGAISNSTVRIATLVADFRPILYWLSGIIIVFAGHRHLKVKTIFWLLTIGLVIQFIFAIVTMMYYPELLVGSGFRLPGHSSYLVLIPLSAYILMKSRNGNVAIQNRLELFILQLSLMLILIYVTMTQNRTTWVAVVLLVAILVIKSFDFHSVLAITKVFGLLALLLFGLFYVKIIPDTAKIYLETRLFESTFSEEGVNSTWEGNRDKIYQSNLSDFKKKPLLGHGFGYIFSFQTVYQGEEQVREVSGLDNSWMTILVKFGIVGLIAFCNFIFSSYGFLRRSMMVAPTEVTLYYKAIYSAFPVLCLVGLNIDILYGYAEVVILSLIITKAVLVVNDKKKVTCRDKFVTQLHNHNEK
jgi:hypothetical protein